ncbi:MAG: ribonuclease HIII [Victivallaceae bacterium]
MSSVEKVKKVNSYVCTVNAEQLAQLAEYLKDRGWKFSEQPYAHWKAAQDKTNIVAYHSGKMTVQGAGTEDFVTFVLEPDILKTAGFGYEQILNPETPAAPEEPFSPHGGIDESGKGDFFGPLVIAGVYADNDNVQALRKIGVKDSKAIKSSKMIYAMAPKIRDAVNGKFSVVAIGPEAYNRMYTNVGNLNRMLAWGHARVIENLLEKAPECPRMLSDKFASEHLIKNALMKNGKTIKMEQRTKAESDVAVAAASILAREMFLRSMDKLSAELKLELPRGASSAVEKMARQIVMERGQETLGRYAKLHFKTYAKIMESFSGEN